LRIDRHLTHALVLAIALAISSYAAIDRGFFSSFHPAAVTSASADEGAVGDVSLGRDSLIIKPVSIPTTPLVSRAPFVHYVAQGDTLESISQQFNLPWRDIVWSNPGLRLPLAVGRPLKLPPVPGVVVVVKRGDTPAGLAAAYGVDVTTVLGFNGIRAPQLLPGLVLVIPVDPALGANLSTGLPDYFGIRVQITDRFGLVEVYAHMSQVAVAFGQEVQQGEKVGYVGSTGLSIGSHLHFQLEVGGMPTDPGRLIGC
jgi:LysM repeat protein